VITFGAATTDMDLIKTMPPVNAKQYYSVANKKALVYIGRGGFDMKTALTKLFTAFSKGLIENSQLYNRFHFYFLGTSYAAAGKGLPTIRPLAEKCGISAYVTESTDRLPYFTTLQLLLQADGLIIPGSDDPAYTASKIYPYLLTQRHIFGMFHRDSSAGYIINQCKGGRVIFTDADISSVGIALEEYLELLLQENRNIHFDYEAFREYTSKQMVVKQVELFNSVLRK
jgi:hypothetical protein